MTIGIMLFLLGFAVLAWCGALPEFFAGAGTAAAILLPYFLLT